MEAVGAAARWVGCVLAVDDQPAFRSALRFVVAACRALVLTGEADSALENLKIAIQLRPENRYHARNDEDFAFLQEDPRFTELLYPEKDGLAS